MKYLNIIYSALYIFRSFARMRVQE